MKLLMALMMMGTMLAFASVTRAATSTGDDDTKQQRAQPMGATAATGAAATNAVSDPKLLAEKEQTDRTILQAQSVVQLQCVTGDCYKDVANDPCYVPGENCIRPDGSAAANGQTSPANADQ